MCKLNQTQELNEFISQQIHNVLSVTKQNINQAIEYIQSHSSPYLNISCVQMLEALSKNTVESYNKILIESEIGYVEKNYIILTKFFDFDSLINRTKVIPYSILYVENFVLVKPVEQNKFELSIAKYEVGENVIDVISNLQLLKKNIELNIDLYTKNL